MSPVSLGNPTESGINSGSGPRPSRLRREEKKQESEAEDIRNISLSVKFAQMNVSTIKETQNESSANSERKKPRKKKVGKNRI